MLRAAFAAFLPPPRAFFSRRLFVGAPRLFTTMGANVQTVNTSKRLQALRQLMSNPDNDVTAYVVPSEDQRTLNRQVTRWTSSPLLNFRLQRVQCCVRRATRIHLWIHGIGRYATSPVWFARFVTPSLLSGCAVITLKDAFLFTDGRYFLQAEKELDQWVS